MADQRDRGDGDGPTLQQQPDTIFVQGLDSDVTQQQLADYINTVLATYSTSSNACDGQQHSDRLLEHWNWLFSIILLFTRYAR